MPKKRSVLAQLGRERVARYQLQWLEERERSQGGIYTKYANDPVGFIQDVLGAELTEETKRVCESVRDNRETNVQAAHGVGKSFTAARLVLWQLYAVGGMCINTAPTDRQVREILWKEIRIAHRKAGLPGTLNQTSLRLSESVYAFGFTARDTNSNAFQGIHHPKLLVIEDEACGISEEIDDGATACITGEANRILRIGNPTDIDTPFQVACAEANIRLPVWHHPNVSWAYEEVLIQDDVGEPKAIHRLKPEIYKHVYGEDGTLLDTKLWADWIKGEKIPGAVSIAWIEKVRVKKGEGSSYWQSRVEAEFPEDSAQSIVPRSWLKAARARYDADPEKHNQSVASKMHRHGLDVGDGGDPHAHARFQGCVLYEASEKQTLGDRLDTKRASEWGYKKLIAHPGSIAVDRVGVGSGTLADILTALEKNNPFNASFAVGVHFGEAAEESDDYINLRAECYWEFREACMRGEVAIAPLGQEIEDRLFEEFAKSYYEETSSEKVRMEDKKKTIKRLKRSPNLADAVVMAWRNQKQKAGVLLGGMTK